MAGGLRQRGDVKIRCEGQNAPTVALKDVVTRLDGGAAAGRPAHGWDLFDCLETIGCEARGGGGDEDVAAAPARPGLRGGTGVGAGAAGPGSSSDDDGAEDGGMPTTATGHAATPPTGAPARRTHRRGTSGSEDSVDRIEAVIARARAAGVPGVESTTAPDRKSVRRRPLIRTASSTIVKRILQRGREASRHPRGRRGLALGGGRRRQRA